MTTVGSTTDPAAIDAPPPTTCRLARVFIVSDVRVTREGLALLLMGGRSVIVAGHGAGSAAAAQITELRPDVVLLDATLDDMAGCARRLRDCVDGVKIVAFALGDVDRELVACAEAGISAFVGRDGSHHDLLRAIDQARRGEFSVSPRQASLLFGRIMELAQTRPRPLFHLTRRQREIVPLIERGLSNKEIARQLSIETATIKNHVHNILAKMQLRSRAQVAAHVRAGPSPVGRSSRQL
jgi:DNA-binding NarL/FixJ family response regulator